MSYSPRRDGPLPPGTRIRNYGQQWPHARWYGTAIIVCMTREYRDGTHEYDVCTDKGQLTSWNYVEPISEEWYR